MRRKGAAGLVAAGMLLLGAAPGQAQELAGARYLGEYKGGTGEYKGGTVDFKVSPDGTRLAEFSVTNEQGQICAVGPFAPPLGTPPNPGLPIANHAFAGAISPGLWISGSFTAPGVASGSFDLTPATSGRGGPPPSCPRDPVSWTAVGDDGTAPALVMNTRATQSRRQKTVKVSVSCPDQACSVLAQGVVSLTAQDVTRRFKLVSASGYDRGLTRLWLAIPRRAYRAIRALGSDGRVTVKVRVTATDRFDNVASARQSIRLKP